MKANTVYLHRDRTCAAVQTTDSEFFTIQLRHRSDLGLADEVTGDLLLNKVKWFFNITRGTLISVNVLGRYSTLSAAISATTASRSVPRPARSPTA